MKYKRRWTSQEDRILREGFEAQAAGEAPRTPTLIIE